MCGLAGVLLAPGERPAEVWDAICAIATANLVANAQRGREAAGVAVVQADGAHHVFKQPVEPGQLVELAGYERALASVGRDTVCILGHARAPTKGSRWRNVNNHPLVAGHVVGVHNGEIANDDALFEQLELPRAGEVDSEIIFRLQDQIDPWRSNGRYVECMAQQVRLLEGTFATLSLDLRAPTGLLVLKHLRPLCVHYEPPWRALFFSSRYIFLRKAFGRSVITEALDSGYGYYYDVGELEENGCRPRFSFPIEE
jgi:glucosamine 6-phosphate synthetase-like amidotransferase/phosphosugar isomerase protein